MARVREDVKRTSKAGGSLWDAAEEFYPPTISLLPVLRLPCIESYRQNPHKEMSKLPSKQIQPEASGVREMWKNKLKEMQRSSATFDRIGVGQGRARGRAPAMGSSRVSFLRVFASNPTLTRRCMPIPSRDFNPIRSHSHAHTHAPPPAYVPQRQAADMHAWPYDAGTTDQRARAGIGAGQDIGIGDVADRDTLSHAPPRRLRIELLITPVRARHRSVRMGSEDRVAAVHTIHREWKRQDTTGDRRRLVPHASLIVSTDRKAVLAEAGLKNPHRVCLVPLTVVGRSVRRGRASPSRAAVQLELVLRRPSGFIRSEYPKTHMAMKEVLFSMIQIAGMKSTPGRRTHMV
ncbi:hypothetical protein R3P38DRAFT_3363110 [Favolaschia claudopus]|uniref:Uncharacterized protein n=1 Tax=Favolaschia claudopus TaxID=2862362 RepID=A0AAW0AJC4_9AGAR